MATIGYGVPGQTLVTLLQAIREALTRRPDAWDADSDETVLYLRKQQSDARRQAERLRGIGIPLTGNILEDNATGAASRWRQRKRIEGAL